MKFDFTYFVLRVLRYYYHYISWVFPYTTKKIKYLVDRGILWKLEAALGQQKSDQACTTAYRLQQPPQSSSSYFHVLQAVFSEAALGNLCCAL
jgi:hypothetical protein